MSRAHVIFSPAQQSKSNTHRTKPLNLGVCDRVSRPSQYPVSPRFRRNPSPLLSLCSVLTPHGALRDAAVPNSQSASTPLSPRTPTPPSPTPCRPQGPRAAVPDSLSSPKDPEPPPSFFAPSSRFSPPSPSPCRPRRRRPVALCSFSLPSPTTCRLKVTHKICHFGVTELT